MDKKILLSTVPIIIALIGGGVIGMYFQFQKDSFEIDKGKKMAAVLNSLSSRAVPSVVAFGSVSKIDGRSITLTYGGENITINISDDVKIYSSSGNEQAIAPFEIIKVGDNLSINIKVIPEGQLQGQSIIILSVAN